MVKISGTFSPTKKRVNASKAFLKVFWFV